ncbi:MULTISPECIES: phage portal protein [Hydrocarboniphaga]|uniref:Phage portal protein, HK97 family n=1 Tax=Hydrocarboniphaga effusa AP103 TaxID=1172194 RepID=I8T7U1_9GAMM|nr:MULTISPECIES: phage portal protein [Hydrocarboniphaga]EIT70000.1 phage portal protein, HK97 family [Hydrocarboniphaga effusa AP103]EIT70187.1 phage portal protein, HK97 family [Hydrocarboniphaga effusa AP103]MDZ4077183.1 phage portal protein [Hydrocarboniphaga sp.]
MKLSQRIAPTVTVTKAGTLAPVGGRNVLPWIREPYAGAWQRNEEVSVETALAHSAVYSCMTLIASDIGKLRPMLMQIDADGIWTETTSAAYSPVLRKPNHFQNRIQFIEWWIMSKLVYGNAYVLKQRDSRRVVVAEYLLDPMRVTPLISSDGSIYYQLGQDVLNGVRDTALIVPASEIIHDRMNCLFHPLVGVSPLFAAGLAAGQGLQMQRDANRFFANGANPGGVLIAPGAISDQTANEIRDNWSVNYGGENAGKIAVLGDGLKFEPMRMTAVDAQVIEQLKWTAENVCSTFHVPAYKIGAAPPPSYNNIEALAQEYYSTCLQTLIEHWEACQDEGLGLPVNYGTELELDSLLRMDTSTLITAEAAAVGAGIKSPNEARKRLNLKPVKGGESPYLQQQNYALAALAERDGDKPFAKALNTNLRPANEPKPGENE